ncbi:hypothetical protein NHQ30_009448 [Ciborinia camelliae]|nr:hypothetical protein NHQ30_009448 [Ciborinia camelliae]
MNSRFNDVRAGFPVLGESRESQTEEVSESQTDFDSEMEEEMIYNGPLTPPVTPQFSRRGYPGRWSLGIQLHKSPWLRYGLIILCLILAYIPYMGQYNRGLKPTIVTEPFGPNRTSKIPLLYKDITYNLSRMEGDLSRGNMDIFPGDSFTLNRRFLNEMPEFSKQKQDFSGLLQQLQIISDGLFHDYTVYYKSLHNHIEDAITLTNSVLEDLVTVAEDWGKEKSSMSIFGRGPRRTDNFKELIGRNTYWCQFVWCKDPLDITRDIYIKYLRALRVGYTIPRNRAFNSHKTVGLFRLIWIGRCLPQRFEATKNTSQELQSAMKLGITALSSKEFKKSSAFVPLSKSKDGTHSGNDTMGYMKNWLDNEFEAGRLVREVKIPTFIRQFQEALENIVESTRRLLNILMHKKNHMDPLCQIECHIEAMQDALRVLTSHYRFESKFSSRMGRLKRMWEVNKRMWTREDEGGWREFSSCQPCFEKMSQSAIVEEEEKSETSTSEESPQEKDDL